MTTGKLAALMNHDFQILEYPVPDPMEGSLVIKVEAASICGSDAHIIKFDVPKPGCEGHEFMGRIISMDAKANEMIHSFDGELKVGDRIAVYPHISCGKCSVCLDQGDGCCACENDFIYGGPHQLGKPVFNCDPEVFPHFKGGFGEYVHIFPGTYVWKVPDDMPSGIASLLDPVAVGMRAVEMALSSAMVPNEGITTTTRALVIGAGPIGVITAMILHTMGVEELIISDLLQEKLDAAKSISGADTTFNVSGMTPDERVAAFLDLTHGGADVVINCASHPASQVEGLQMAKVMGTFIEVGNPMAFGGKPFEVTVSLPKVVFSKNVKVLGLTANYPKTFDRSFRLLKRHKEMPFGRLITHPFHKLEDLKSTMDKMGDIDYLKGTLIFE